MGKWIQVSLVLAQHSDSVFLNRWSPAKFLKWHPTWRNVFYRSTVLLHLRKNGLTTMSHWDISAKHAQEPVDIVRCSRQYFPRCCHHSNKRHHKHIQQLQIKHGMVHPEPLSNPITLYKGEACIKWDRHFVLVSYLLGPEAAHWGLGLRYSKFHL